MPIHKLEELTWKQLDDLPRDETAIFLPVSPLEEHGTHLPIGTDAMNAVHFARVSAEEFVRADLTRHALLAPLVPLGTWTFDFVGSIWIRQRIIRDLVADWGESFARYGFRHILVFNGHGAPGHVVALEEACARVTRKYRRQGVQMVSPIGAMIGRYFSGQYGRALQEEVSPPMPAADAEALPLDKHAGYFETSSMLYLRPDLVQEHYRDLPGVVVPTSKLWFSTARKAGDGLGYLGWPAKARREIGEAAERLVRREVGSLMERMVAGEDVSADVLSVYSRVPMFRTDFWRWLAVSAAASAVATWLALG